MEQFASLTTREAAIITWLQFGHTGMYVMHVNDYNHCTTFADTRCYFSCYYSTSCWRRLMNKNLSLFVKLYKFSKIHCVMAHTHNCFTALDFIWDNPGEPVPEETFTHSQLSWSTIVPCLLLPSNTIHGILPIQSMHLTVFPHLSIN